MKPLEIQCACGQVRRLEADKAARLAGKSLKCPKCGQDVAVPEREAEEEPAEEAPAPARKVKKVAFVGTTAFLVLYVFFRVGNAYLRHERVDRLLGVTHSAPSLPRGPSAAERQLQADRDAAAARRPRIDELEAEQRELRKKEQAAASAAREEARKKEEADRQAAAASKAADQKPARDAKLEFNRMTSGFVALRAAAKVTLERALTAHGRERLRGGAKRPWDVEALVGAEVEYDVSCQAATNPDKPSAGSAPARGRVWARLTGSVLTKSSNDWLLAGTEELSAALDLLVTLEREHGLPLTTAKLPDGRLTQVSFFQGKPGQAHELLQAEEGVSVTVPAGTFTGHHVRARHDGKEYELWFGDELALPWRVLLPEEKGARATIELAAFRAPR